MAIWDWESVVPTIGLGSGSDDGRGYAALQQVRAYWQGLRLKDALPSRAHIDPRGMDSALEHVFLVERVAPGVARFRLAGMHLTLLMGLDVRGMPLTAFLQPAARDAARALVDRVFSDPAILELALEAERGMGRAALEGRMLLLPVIGDEGVCDRALGCFVTKGAIGRNPRRFAISGHSVQGIASDVPFAKPPVAVQRQPQPGFADATRGFIALRPEKTRSPRSRSHLRLVKSDE